MKESDEKYKSEIEYLKKLLDDEKSKTDKLEAEVKLLSSDKTELTK